MKNYSRFKLMIMLLCFIITGITSYNAMAIRTITIGSNSIPDDNWPSSTQPNTVSTAIYRAAELNQSGRSYLISKLGFYVLNSVNPSANSIDNVYILLKNTNSTNAELPVAPCGMDGINALVANGFKIVKGPFILRGNQLNIGQFNDFDFTSPFQYDGTSNLHLVVVSVNQQNTTNGSVNSFSIGTFVNATGLTNASAFYSPANYCRATDLPHQLEDVRPYIRLEIEDATYTGQTYLSSNCEQSILTLTNEGDANVNVLKIEIKIHGENATLNNLTQMIFDGKTSLNYATIARLYYTGTTPAFNTSNQITYELVRDTNIHNITFNGNVQLSHGSNYFWLAYDISSGMADNGNVDAALKQFTLSRNGVITNTTNKDPEGSIYIKKSSDIVQQIPSNNSIGGETYVGTNYTYSYSYSGYLGYYSSSYAVGYCESIYRPGELGLTAGATINNLAWQLYGNYSYNATLRKVSVWLKNSDTNWLVTGVPDTINGGYTKVLSNVDISIVPFVAYSWLVFNFDVPFTYTGQNLQVLITRDGRETGSATYYLYNYYSYGVYQSRGYYNGYYDHKYGYGASSYSTNTNVSSYKPTLCINKYENSKLCTRSCIVQYEGDVTPTTIRNVWTQPPYTSPYTYTVTNTYHGTMGYYPKSMANYLYPPNNMGNVALGNCPRTITGITLYQNYRYFDYYCYYYPSYPQFTDDFYDSTTVSYPIEIWIRNTSDVTLNTTNTNPTNFYNNLASNGFVKCFEGTFIRKSRAQKIHLEFNQNNFQYDGNSSVEVFWYYHHPTYASTYDYFVYNGSSYTNYMYMTFFTPTNTSNNYCRYAYSTTAGQAGTPTSWSGTTYFVPAIDWDYEPQSMILNNISVSNVPDPKVTTKEFVLFGTFVQTSTDRTCDPPQVRSIKVKLNNSANATIDKLKVYTTNYVTFAEPTLITTLYNPQGNEINIQLPSNQYLNAGTTRYWVTAEVSDNTECLSTVSGQLLSINLSGKEYDNRYYERQSYSPATVEYDPISFPRRVDDKICFTKTDSIYTVNVEGSVGLYQWYLWDKTINNYKAVQGATSNYLNIYTDNIINGNNKAQVVALPPPGNCSAPATLNLNFSISYPARDVYTSVDGYITSPTDTFTTCYEEELVFIGHYEGDANSFQWEYLDAYNRWQPISLADVLTANMDTMYFVPGPKFRNATIRFVAYSDLACNSYAASIPFSVKAFAPNRFALQPPQKVNLCKGERLYVTVVFNGETPKKAQWYKDGFPLQYNLDQILDITAVNLSDAGTYWYEVAAGGCNGDEVIKSTPMQIFINPDPYIISQPSTVKAHLEDVALLKIEANYVPNAASESLFQWFRHNGIENTNTLLVENDKILGTQSNILAIIPIGEGDYTYNGDYYFCQIHALCGDGITTSKPIYLLPGNQMLITRHPENVLLCSDDLPTDVTFDVYAFTSDDNTKLFYQWYEGNTELLNNTEFSGVNTQHLTVRNVNDIRTYGRFYCRVWYFGDDPYTDFIMSNDAFIHISHPANEITNIDTINVLIGDTVILKENATTAPLKSMVITAIEWFYIDGNGTYHTLPTPNPYTSTYNIERISIYQAGMYAVRTITPCNTVEQKFQVNVTSKPGPEAELSIADGYNVELQVSPNPAFDVADFTFTSPEGKDYNVEVTDIAGAVVYSISGISNANNIIKLDIEKLNLTSGSYMFNLTLDGKKTTKSFVITR